MPFAGPRSWNVIGLELRTDGLEMELNIYINEVTI